MCWCLLMLYVSINSTSLPMLNSYVLVPADAVRQHQQYLTANAQ
jgi:hypothetical protein